MKFRYVHSKILFEYAAVLTFFINTNMSFVEEIADVQLIFCSDSW